ncbi:hypothetical protein AOLI_G00103840 [Acnodon oligacanthus]
MMKWTFDIISSHFCKFSKADWIDWFGNKLVPLLPSLTAEMLTITIAEVDCATYHVIIEGLNMAFEEMTLMKKKNITRVLVEYLKVSQEADGSGLPCGSGTKSASAWLWVNFGKYSIYVSLQDLQSLNPEFSKTLQINPAVRDIMMKWTFDIISSRFCKFSKAAWIDWFGNKLVPLLPSLTTEMLTITIAEVNCATYHVIIEGLNMAFEEMTLMTKQNITHVLVENLKVSQEANGSGLCCGSGTKSASAWLWFNFGKYSIYVSLQDLQLLNHEFSKTLQINPAVRDIMMKWTFDIISSNFSKFSKADWIDWFGSKLVPLLPSLTAEMLTITIAEVDCATYHVMVESDIVSFFLLCFVSGLPCGSGTKSASDWLWVNFGKYSIYVSLQDLQLLNPEFSNTLQINPAVRDIMMKWTFDIINSHFCKFSRAAWIDWFGSKLVPLLPSLTAEMLTITIAEVDCATYHVIIEGLNMAFEEMTLMTKQEITRVLVEYLKVSQEIDGSGLPCGSGTKSASDWLWVNFGKYSIYVSLRDLQLLNPEFSKTLQINPAVRDIMTKWTFDIISSRFSKFSKADWIDWFGSKLVPLLPSLTAEMLTITIADVDCATYHVILESDLMNFFLHCYFSGLPCGSGTKSANDWLWANFGKYSIYVSLQDLQLLNHEFSKTLQIHPAVRDIMMKWTFDIISSNFSKFSKAAWIDWFGSKLAPLLPSVTAEMLTITIADVDCATYHVIIEGLNMAFEEMTLMKKQEITHVLVKNLKVSQEVDGSGLPCGSGTKSASAWLWVNFGKYSIYVSLQDLQSLNLEFSKTLQINPAVRDILMKWTFDIISSRFSKFSKADWIDWFGSKLVPLLPSLTAEMLTITIAEVDCATYHVIIEGLNRAFEEMTLMTKQEITRVLVEYLKDSQEVDGSGLPCGSGTKSASAWLWVNFGKYSIYVSLQDLQLLNHEFSKTLQINPAVRDIMMKWTFDIISNNFFKFSKADWIDWFGSKLVPLLPSLTAEMLTITIAEVDCATYHVILESDLINFFLHCFVSGLPCGSGTKSASDWLWVNFGKYSIYVSLQDLQLLNHEFSKFASVDLFTLSQACDVTVESGALQNIDLINVVLNHLGKGNVWENLEELLVSLRRKSQTLQINPAVRDIVMKWTFDIISSRFCKFSKADWIDWFGSKLVPLLPSLTAEMLTITIAEVDCATYHAIIEGLNMAFEEMTLMKRQEITRVLVKYLKVSQEVDGSGLPCGSGTKSASDWLWVNFGKYSIYVSLQDLQVLNPEFSKPLQINPAVRDIMMKWTFDIISSRFCKFSKADWIDWFGSKLVPLLPSLTAEMLTITIAEVDCATYHAIVETDLINFFLHCFVSGLPCGSGTKSASDWLWVNFGKYSIYVSLQDLQLLNPEFSKPLQINPAVRDILMKWTFDIISSRFSNFSKADWIDWFGSKLVPLLPSLTAEMLTTTIADVDCATYHIIVKGLDTAFDEMTLSKKMEISLCLVEYMKKSQEVNISGSPCSSDTNNASNWLLVNFGKFSIYVSLEDLQSLTKDFSWFLSLRTTTRLPEKSSASLTSPSTRTTALSAVPPEVLPPHLFIPIDDFSTAVTLPITQGTSTKMFTSEATASTEAITAVNASTSAISTTSLAFQTEKVMAEPAKGEGVLTLHLRMQRVFISAYNNTASAEYITLAKNITSELDRAYQELFAHTYLRCYVLRFWPNPMGVDVQLIFRNETVVPNITFTIDSLISAIYNLKVFLDIIPSNITATVGQEVLTNLSSSATTGTYAPNATITTTANSITSATTATPIQAKTIMKLTEKPFSEATTSLPSILTILLMVIFHFLT